MKKILFVIVILFSGSLLMGQVTYEESPNSATTINKQKSSKGAWNVQFNYTAEMPVRASAGVETDGSHFYVTQWNDSKIWKLDSSGTMVDSFSIAGVSGLRDLAYDGNYFYGGTAGNTIYKMDFSNQTLVGSITSPNVKVRHICYDPTADNGNGAFWVGNWDTDLTLVSRNGNVLNTISSGTHSQGSMYGSAYDTITPGGPYIWVISATSSVNTSVTQLDVSSGAPTGLAHDVTKDICSVGQIGGGMFIHHDIVKNGTKTLGGVIQNHSIFGYDMASIVPDTFDLAVETFDMPSMVPQGQNVNIKGTITNQGKQTINSFDLNYKVDNGNVVTENITGVNISSYGNYNYTHSTPWSPSSGSHNVKVWISNPNGNTDQYHGNDTLAKTIVSYDPANEVQRMPLHEVFASSTCPYCRTGNANLQSIFSSNPDKWVCIKYPMSFPGSGDPYYTAEGGVRRQFYGVTSVPDQRVDGGHAFEGNTNNYTSTDLNNAYAKPAFVDINANMTISASNQSVDLNISIDNNISLPSSTKLYVGIIEEKTTQNTGGNGETEFFYIMKKMLPDANGKTIGPLNADAGYTDSMSYTFNGSYRLPSSANNPIDHATEHSVEEFSDLNAVVWLQDPSNKKVFQSTYANYPVGIKENENTTALNVYPNPTSGMLNIDVDDDISGQGSLKIINNLGEVVYSRDENLFGDIRLNTNSYSGGIYFVRIHTENGSVTKPVIIKH